MPNKGELLIPPAVTGDPRAQEMLRAWIAHQDLHCSLQVGVWGGDEEKEMLGWGILLTDVVRHVADALYREKGLEKEATVYRIRQVFNAELDFPTAEPTGDFV